jgi:hypothetical protein
LTRFVHSDKREVLHREKAAVGKFNDLTVMTSVQSPSLAEESSIIRVAIVCESETAILAEVLLERESQVGEEIGRSVFAGLIRTAHDNIHSNHSTQTNKKGK